ncbi:hypothetical protein ABPG75_012090 [Micractinium tetrahymenae]
MPQRAGERGSPAEQEKGERKPKCCLGALYFSEARYAAQKPPVCTGFAKRLKPTDDAAQLPTDSVPGGDFKYICLGYSAWDEEALKRAAAARRSQADAVQLPYCEGLEVVSAAAVNQRPELMGAGAPGLGAGGGAAAAGEPVAGPPQAPGGADVRQRPGRSFVPGRLPEVPDGMDWDRFKERFLRISRRMVDKMGQNLTFMASTTKRSWQQLRRELGGSDKER